MSILARWCHRHRMATLFARLGLVVALVGLAGSAGTKYDDTMSIPASESSQAMDLLKTAMPAASGDSDTVVWHTTGGAHVTDAAVRSRMTQTLDQIAGAPGVAAVTSPYGERGAAQISKDGTVAYASVTFDGQARDLPKAEVTHVIDLARGARTDGLHVELGGQAISEATSSRGGSSEMIGVLAALVVLGLVFRSVGAAALPILTGVVGVATGVLLTGQLSHAVGISSTAPTLAMLVGLGGLVGDGLRSDEHWRSTWREAQVRW